MIEPIKFRFHLVWFFWALATSFPFDSAVGQDANSQSSVRKPNIVFFLVDDQRNNTLGCAGHPIIKTPTIDSLAARGVRFENCFVSYSICWVSRTSILCGLTARSFGEPAEPDRAKSEVVEQLYTDLLHQAGYRTGLIGKWHAKMPPGFQPKDHFDVFQPITRNPYHKIQADGSKRHETEMIVDQGIKFIKNLPASQPFALNLWFNAAHAEDNDRRPGSGHFPWPMSVDGMYDETEIPAPSLSAESIFASQPDFLKLSLNRERYFWRWDTPEKYQNNMRAYFRMLSGVDHAIKRFLDELERAGLADNTIIVYSADNGYYMGDRGFAGKWSHYEQSLRVPLIIFDPRINEPLRGRVVDELALNIDLPCTFLDWAGVEIPNAYQGRSLRPIVENRATKDWRMSTFHEHVSVRNRIPAWEGIRTNRFKYARYIDQEPVFEFLHDLERDPNELKNLATDHAYSQTLDDLREQCDQQISKLGSPREPLKK